MVTTLTNDALGAGDRVGVPWGLDEIPGTIIEVYGAGLLARVRVRVSILGANGEELGTEDVTLPLGWVRG